MQFKSTVYVQYSAKNEFGELTLGEKKPMKCAVIRQHKSNQDEKRNELQVYDLRIITAAKSFRPYSDLLNLEDLVIEFEGKLYTPRIVTVHRGIGGQPKFHELHLDEKRA